MNAGRIFLVLLGIAAILALSAWLIAIGGEALAHLLTKSGLL
jgi:hypothetical protein